MSNKWIISSHQFKLLVTLCYLGRSLLVTPRSLAAISKQDAWIAALFGILGSILIIWIYNSLSNLLTDMSLVQYIEKLLGKWMGKFIAICFVLFALLNTALLLSFMGNFITTQILIDTPVVIINSFFVIVIVIGTRLGLETFARAAEILYPYVIGFLSILILLIIKEINYHNILPVLEYGIVPIIRGTLSYMSYSSVTLILLLMIFPACVNEPSYCKKSFFSGALVSGSIIFLLTILNIMILGYDQAARNTFSSYILAKKISVGNIIERVEVVIAISWIITIYFKILIYFYGAVSGLSQILNLKEYKSLTMPLAMIMVFLSLIVYPNNAYASQFNSTTWVLFSFTFGFILPLFLLLFGNLREKGKMKKQPYKK